MSTSATPPQPPLPEGDLPSGTPETVEVTFIAPAVVDPSEARALAAVDAPVATGGGISAPMPGAGAFSFAMVGGRLRDLWRMLTPNPKVMVGLCIVLVFILVAIVGP